MADYPVLPVYVRDLLGDTSHLSPEEFGAYCRIFMTMWLAPTCDLPLDDRRLARIAGAGRRWGCIRSTVMEFFTVEGDRITQKRLKTEHIRVTNLCLRNASKGRLGGLAKSLKSKEAKLAAATSGPQPSSGIPYPDISFGDSSLFQTGISSESVREISPPAARSRAKAKTLLPEGWALSEKDREYARSKGWQDRHINRGAEKFAAYHQAKGNAMADWSAAWRTWVGNAIAFAERDSRPIEVKPLPPGLSKRAMRI